MLWFTVVFNHFALVVFYLITAWNCKLRNGHTNLQQLSFLGGQNCCDPGLIIFLAERANWTQGRSPSWFRENKSRLTHLMVLLYSCFMMKQYSGIRTSPIPMYYSMFSKLSLNLRCVLRNSMLCAENNEFTQSKGDSKTFL